MKNFYITLIWSAALFAAAGSRSTAHADLNIIPIWDSTVTSDPNAALVESTIETTISNIEGDIANTETIYVKFKESPTVLGESNTTTYSEFYSSYLSALENDQTLSSEDTTALGSLGLTSPFSTPPTNNTVNGGNHIVAAGPLLRTLGFTQGVANGNAITSSSSSPDSTITFNGNEQANVIDDSIETPPYYECSLESVVAHELDEVLSIGGGGSELNKVALGTSGTGPIGPLDLYRYSGAGVRSYTTGTGAIAYFSINSGTTNLDYFNQDGGGGDYGDWGNGTPNSITGNTPSQVQDAWATAGTAPQLGSSELTGLDVVGWNLTSQGQAIEAGAVPEPATYASILLGGLGLAGMRRRRRG